MKYDSVINNIRDEMIRLNYVKALKLCKDYLTKLKKESNKQSLNDDFYYGYYLAGYNYKHLKDYSRAVKYEIEALKYIQHDQYETRYANTIMMLGNCYDELGIKNEAIKLFKTSSRLYEAIGLTKWQLASTFNVYRTNKDIEGMKQTINLYKDIVNEKDNGIYNEKAQVNNVLNLMEDELNEIQYAYAN